ncbi:unnamed protein product [Effrenium voratum]|nr:unnamed protein product [Effrenium voratum]
MAATAFLAAPFHAPGAAPRAEAAGAAGPAGPPAAPAAGGAVGWRTDGAWGLVGLAALAARRRKAGRTRAASPKSPEVKGPKGPEGKPEAKAKRPAAFEPSKQIGVTAPLGYFDPLGIAPKDEETFFEYRACEIKHGRVAMMAALGAVAQHFVRLPGFEQTIWGEPMPAGIRAAWANPAAFGFVALALVAGVLEFTIWKEDPERGAGNFGDPLGLNQYTEDMRNRELNNGRFAMFAALGIVAADLATGKDAVQQLGL